MTDAEPTILERSSVPQFFPVFRNTAALAHLAHCRKGPRYVLIGGKAWYEVSDIRVWLESSKQHGPPGSPLLRGRGPAPPFPTKKRGRPSKMEQYERRVRAGLEKAARDVSTGR
jgi:hypothetical protein